MTSPVAVKAALRDLRGQLSLLNQRVGTRLDLRGTELDCLDLIVRHGPLSPGALARRTALHPATLTGVLDRLERGGWIVRERDPADRRAVVLQAVSARKAAVFGLYAGMNDRIDQICAGYTGPELARFTQFLRQLTEAGQQAGDELTLD